MDVAAVLSVATVTSLKWLQRSHWLFMRYGQLWSLLFKQSVDRSLSTQLLGHTGQVFVEQAAWEKYLNEVAHVRKSRLLKLWFKQTAIFKNALWCLKNFSKLTCVSMVLLELSFCYAYRFMVEEIALLIALHKRESFCTACYCIMI